MSVLTPASNTAHFTTTLRHFGFPRTAGAFWERRETPGPNGSSPEPRGGGDCVVSAEEHRALRPRPGLNKEGLFNFAVGLSPSAAGANTIVNAELGTLRCPASVCVAEGRLCPTFTLRVLFLRNKTVLATSCLASILYVEKISYLHPETCCSNFIQRGKDPGCQNYILFGDYCPVPNSFLSEAAYIEDFRTFFP